MSDYHVAIVGGALTGASLAAALRGGGKRVVLIETAAPASVGDGEPTWDERCIALNDASVRILEALGLWPRLSAVAAPIRATHVSERGRFGVIRYTAAEAGLPALGYNVPLRTLGGALWTTLADGAVDILQPARVIAVRPEASRVQLEIESGADTRSLSARLVVAADGARSSVRAQLGIGASTRDYAQHAIVSAVRLSRPHRGIAYERFTADGPVALIPKPGDAASLVWTLPSARADALLEASAAEYLAQAQQAFGDRLGRFIALGRRWAFPLSRVLSATLTAPRAVFVGNAAQSLHPVAAQGFNLGLRDVATLAELIAKADDPGLPEVLEAYSARREQDRRAVAGFTDLMVRTFSNRLPGLSQSRHWGLLAVDLLPPLRRRVLQQHLGHLGLPLAIDG